MFFIFHSPSSLRSAQMRARLSLIGLILAFAPAISAQSPPTLTAPKPISLQRGQAIDVTLAGSALASVTSAVVTQDSGLTATLGKSEKPDEQATLTISAAADAAPGARELRLVSPARACAPAQAWGG